MCGKMRPVALSVAGSDPSGGAGIQADLKTFHQFEVYGTAVLTVVTVQNTRKVLDVVPLDARLVERQLEAVMEDIPPDAAKVGALGNEAVTEVAAAWAQRLRVPLVVDPAMVSKHGAPLIETGAVRALRERLLPLAYLATPNLDEAAALAGIEVDTPAAMEEAAKRIAGGGARNVLVKGGHLSGEPVDLLWSGGSARWYGSARCDTPHTHGTGCVYSAAVTALLARGRPLPQAVEQAKSFIGEAIRTAPGLGRGNGPVNHHAPTCPDDFTAA